MKGLRKNDWDTINLLLFKAKTQELNQIIHLLIKEQHKRLS